MIEAIMLFMLFACWGSFLNVVGYRIIRHEGFIWGRSHCPHCARTLAWFELIPIFSWLALRGHCRTCRQPISWLYPALEILAGGTLTVAVLKNPDYALGTIIFFSALLVAVRTDLECMLISRYTTLFLIPAGWALSYWGFLSITPLTSFAGSLIGYGLLYFVHRAFLAITGRHGLGLGDAELLALIGAFTGPLGCWCSLAVGSIVGSILGVMWMIVTGKNLRARIPFGPLLAFGAGIYTVYRPFITSLIFPA